MGNPRLFDIFDGTWPYPIKLLRDTGESYYGAGGFVDVEASEIDLEGHFAPVYRVEDSSGVTADKHLGVIEDGMMSFFTYFQDIREGDTIIAYEDVGGTNKTPYTVTAVKRNHNLLVKLLKQDPRVEIYLTEKVDN